MLKLKDATYPDPERLALIDPYADETTLDFGKDGSKWSHGYVPLNPAAVALKHHKQPGGDGGGSTAKGLASRDSGAGSRQLSGDLAAERRRDPSVAAHHKESAALNGFRLDSKPTAAKSAEPREFKTMKQRRVEASPRAFVNSGDVRLHATKDDGGSKIGTVSKYPSGGFRAQHKDDATAHAGSPFATRQEAVGALVLQHESRTPKTQSERVADIRAGKVQVYNVQTGKTEHVSSAEATAGHIRYGQSLGAGSAAAGQTVKNALEAEAARRNAASLDDRGKLRSLGGYGTNDLKRISKLTDGPHDLNHAPQATIDAAEAELRARGYVKGPSGAWAKPSAPKVKTTGSGLRGTSVTKRQQANPGTSARSRNLLSQKALYGK